MRESHELTDLGGMKGSVGSRKDWGRRNRQVARNVYLPEAVGGVAAVASQDCLIIMGDCHGMLGEGGGAISIAELANGQEWRVEAVKDVGFGGSCREAGNGKIAHGMRHNVGAVGKGHRDGRWVRQDIGKASSGGRKEVASSAGVSNYRFGRGINWCGRKWFN